MTWTAPTCSQDVAERREFTAADEPTTGLSEAADAVLHARYCRDSWIGEDSSGRPIPCPQCHAGIHERLARSSGRAVG